MCDHHWVRRWRRSGCVETQDLAVSVIKRCANKRKKSSDGSGKDVREIIGWRWSGCAEENQFGDDDGQDVRENRGYSDGGQDLPKNIGSNMCAENSDPATAVVKRCVK